ncbi:MAG: sigma-70 family RNA polymerase sigma factor [Planctomycetes bacterium]|nr:sigma-70 family RNA polymerase sigma factor [Planctomycetota bacterium]
MSDRATTGPSERARPEGPEPRGDVTRELLQEWYRGSREALDTLLQRDLVWLQSYVRDRLGERLRQKHETMDIVQEAAVDILRYGPRFLISDRRQFRSLLGKILENNLRDLHRRSLSQRRNVDRERALPSETMLDLDGRHAEAPRPDENVARDDFRCWIRLALEFLDDADRSIIVMRQFEDRSFKDIGEELACDPDTARMRFHRALPKLADKIRQLRNGKIDTLLDF